MNKSEASQNDIPLDAKTDSIVDNKLNTKGVILFLVITLVLSCICYYVRIVGGDKAQGMTSILMYCPAIAAWTAYLVFLERRKL